MLTSASTAVSAALSGVVLAARVEVTVPDSRVEATRRCGLQLGLASAAAPPPADLRVTAASSWRGPVTVRARGCGEPGEVVLVPGSWLRSCSRYNNNNNNNNNSSSLQQMQAAELLAWQLIKLRFGVAAVTGFPGDPVYPPLAAPCPRPLALTCPAAATKHEALCRGRSVMEVIQRSETLAQLRGRGEGGAGAVPVFRFVRRAAERVVVVLETAAGRHAAWGWDWVGRAVRHSVLHSVPAPSQLGLVTFSAGARLEQAPGGNLSRAEVADLVPDKYRLAREDTSCLECGLEAALAALPGPAPSHLLLVTTNTSTAAPAPAPAPALLTRLARAGARVSSLVLGRSCALCDQLAHHTRGRVLQLRLDQLGPVAGYLQLLTQLGELLGAGHQLLHEAAVTVTEGATITRGQFEVEAGAGAELWLVVEDTVSPLVREVSFTRHPGLELGPYTRLATPRLGLNMLALHRSPLARAPASRWTYTVSWWPPQRARAVEAGVLVTAARARPRYTARLWASAPQLAATVTAAAPLALFASVTEAGTGLAVLGARVTATCTVTTEAEEVTLEAVQLRDSGAGDPDITAGDGVYSRYLVRYPGPGRYECSLAVTDNSGAAFTLTRDSAAGAGGAEECCGSRVQLLGGRRRATGSFVVTSPAALVRHLALGAGAGRGEDMPPARIGDLAVAAAEVPGRVAATFTAPGADWDHGLVAGYRLLAARTRPELVTAEAATIFTEFRAAEDGVAGARVRHEVSLDVYNEVVHVAVVGVDSAGNVGEVSNIAAVFLPALRPAEQLTDASEAAPEAEADYSLVLALCGAIVFLASFLGLGVLYFLKVLRQHQLEDKSRAGLASVSLGQSTPAYWSATQLLAKHESKLGLVSAGVRPSTRTRLFLDSISEEEEEEIEVEDTMEDTSEDSLGHLADHGYRDPAVQIVNINTNVFHQRNFSLV